MKRTIVILFAGVVVFSACKKTTEKLRQLTSFTVVNATTDITTAKAYAADHEIAWSTLPTTENVLQYASNHYTALAGAILVKTVNAADTTKVLFASTGKTEVLEEAKLSTLFLAGNTTAGYEGILLKNEDLPLYSDSVMGIRYINLVPGSTGLNVTLSTSTTVNEAANLNYKQITDFKTYPALQSTAAITFQVRDAANVLLGSFILPYTPPGSGNYRTSAIPFARFKNLTLVIKGAIGGTGANVIGIFPVPHY